LAKYVDLLTKGNLEKKEKRPGILRAERGL